MQEENYREHALQWLDKADNAMHEFMVLIERDSGSSADQRRYEKMRDLTNLALSRAQVCATLALSHN